MSKIKGNWSGSETYENQPHGLGTFTSSNGDTYKGTFNYGQITGQGEVKYSNGSSFSGEFSGGQANGHGTYKDQFGNEVSGYFENGVLVETDAQRERKRQAEEARKKEIRSKFAEETYLYYKKLNEEIERKQAIIDRIADQNKEEFKTLRKKNKFKIFKDHEYSTYYIGETRNGIPYGFGKFYFDNFEKTLTGVFINDGVFGITTYVEATKKPMTKICFDYKYVWNCDTEEDIVKQLPVWIVGFLNDDVCTSFDTSKGFYPDAKYEKQIINHAKHVLSIRDELLKYHKIEKMPDFYYVKSFVFEKVDDYKIEKYSRRYIKIYFRGPIIEGPVKRIGPFTIIKNDGTLITGVLGKHGVISNYKEVNYFGEIKTTTTKKYSHLINDIDMEERSYYFKHKR